ncbi:hypothetical protein NXH76_01480 [Blautia schinkii]|nr:hypothetical protein [Blautia schinkii]
MQKQSFRIVMHTSIGERCGTMTAVWEGEQIKGLMEILGHTEAFYGYVDEEGNCRFDGQIISLTRIIPYTAVGKVNHDTLQLCLRGERDVFEVTGVPYAGNGGMQL